MAALLLCQEEAEEQELDLLLMLGKEYCYHSSSILVSVNIRERIS